MKNYKNKSQRVLAVLLGVLSSGCYLNVSAAGQNNIRQNEQVKNETSILTKLLIAGGAVASIYGTNKIVRNVVRHKLWEGSKELKGIDLSNILQEAIKSWFWDTYNMNVKVEVNKIYKEDNGKSTTIYDISADWPGRQSTGLDVAILGQNCYTPVFLANPIMLYTYDHLLAIERSGYGPVSDDVDVPENMDELRNLANKAFDMLPKTNNEREVLCFSMGGAEASELMKKDELNRFRLWSPVDLKAYTDNSTVYKAMSWLYSDLDVSWSENMVEALSTRTKPLTVNVASGDMTDKLCAVKSLKNTAVKKLNWQLPDNWNDLDDKNKAKILEEFYNKKFNGKLKLTVDIVDNMNHEGNALMVQKLHEQEAQKNKYNKITPGGYDDKTFLDYLIRYAEYATDKNGNKVEIGPLKELLENLKENSFSWGV